MDLNCNKRDMDLNCNKRNMDRIGWISVIFLCTSTLCIWAIILIIKLLIKYELIQ